MAFLTTPTERQSGFGEARPEARERAPRRLLVRRALAFGGAGGLLALMALEGAAYDVVPRHQIALVAWLLVAGGFAFGLLPRGLPSRLGLVPLAGALGLVAWMGLSLIWTDSAERTYEEIARLLGYLGLMTLALAALNRHTFRAAAAGITTAAVAVVAVAVASRLDTSLFPQALDVAIRFDRTDRLNFPLDYWNAIGTWGAMTAAMCVVWSAHARSSLLRALALSAAPVAGVAVYVSYSRGGVVATAVALVAAIALARNRITTLIHALAACGGAGIAILVIRGQPEIANATGDAGAGAVLAALGGAAALCAAAVALTWIVRADAARLPAGTPRWIPAGAAALGAVIVLAAGQGPISEAWDEFRSEDSETSGSDPAARLTSAGGNRDDIWSSAIDAHESEPLTGIGPGTFEFWWQANGGDEEYIRDAHSLYLEVLAELGIPGLVLLLILLGGTAALALGARRSLPGDADLGANAAMLAAFAVFCVSAGLDWMWEETAVGALALGGLAIAAAGGSPRLRRRGRHGQVGRRGLRTALVVVAVAAAAVQVPGLVATDRIRASEDALATGDAAGARALAQDAVDAESWSASAWAQLANSERAAGDLAAAERAIGEAVDREPLNWRWPLVLSRIQAERGRRADAVATFKQGRALAPWVPFYGPDSIYWLTVYGD